VTVKGGSRCPTANPQSKGGRTQSFLRPRGDGAAEGGKAQKENGKRGEKNGEMTLSFCAEQGYKSFIGKKNLKGRSAWKALRCVAEKKDKKSTPRFPSGRIQEGSERASFQLVSKFKKGDGDIFFLGFD